MEHEIGTAADTDTDTLSRMIKVGGGNASNNTPHPSQLFITPQGKVSKVLCHASNTSTHCPWKPIRWGQNKMHIREFTAIIDINGPKSAKPVIIAQIDPQCSLPQWLLNFLIKNLAGVVLNCYTQQARKAYEYNQLSAIDRAAKSCLNTTTCSSPASIEKNKEWYKEWLLPKLKHYGQSKHWEMENISVLGEDGLLKDHLEIDGDGEEEEEDIQHRQGCKERLSRELSLSPNNTPSCIMKSNTITTTTAAITTIAATSSSKNTPLSIEIIECQYQAALSLKSKPTIATGKRLPKPSEKEQLLLYSMYKFINVGICNIPRPTGWTDFEGKAKWDAWSSFSQTMINISEKDVHVNGKKAHVMLLYIELMKSICK